MHLLCDMVIFQIYRITSTYSIVTHKFACQIYWKVARCEENLTTDKSTEIAIHILAITRNVLAHNLIKDNILCAAYRYKHVVQ